jgi:hypothetical protein
MLGEILKEQMEEEQHYEQALQQFLSRSAIPLKSSEERYPQRESLYER